MNALKVVLSADFGHPQKVTYSLNGEQVINESYAAADILGCKPSSILFNTFASGKYNFYFETGAVVSAEIERWPDTYTAESIAECLANRIRSIKAAYAEQYPATYEEATVTFDENTTGVVSATDALYEHLRDLEKKIDEVEQAAKRARR